MSRLEGLREPRRAPQATPLEETKIDPNATFTDDGYVPRESFDETDDGFGEEVLDDDELDNLLDEDYEDLDALFDEIDEDGDGTPLGDEDKLVSALDRFIARIDKTNAAPETGNESDGEDTFTTFFDNIYGEGLDFSSMFDANQMEDGQIEEINGNLNKQFKSLMQNSVRQTMEAVMKMVDTHVSTKLEGTQKAQEAARARTKLQRAIIKGIPQLGTPRHIDTFKTLYESAYKRSEGDPKKTAEMIKKLYRKTNPEFFRNNKTASFARTRNSRKKQSKPTSDAWGAWLDS